MALWRPKTNPQIWLTTFQRFIVRIRQLIKKVHVPEIKLNVIHFIKIKRFLSRRQRAKINADNQMLTRLLSKSKYSGFNVAYFYANE